MTSKAFETEANFVVAERPLHDDRERVSSIMISTSNLEKENPALTSSSSGMLGTQSQLSSDVDYWLRGYNTDTDEPRNRVRTISQHQTQMNDVSPWLRIYGTSTGVQNSRIPMMQQSTLTTGPPLGSGIWYMLAMILPFFNFRYDRWRCSPSAILNTAEMVCGRVAILTQRLRANLVRLSQGQIAQDIFATVMDIVLVVYAAGFFVMTMYQSNRIR